jgi:hypothetical protein
MPIAFGALGFIETTSNDGFAVCDVWDNRGIIPITVVNNTTLPVIFIGIHSVLFIRRRG